jgi:hypothetical protein
MEPVLIHHRLDRRDLGHLMPQRFGVLAVEVVTATPTRFGLAVDDLPESLRRDQSPAVVAMTGLATGLLARGPPLGRSLDRRGIGRGGLGGVGGVGVEPLFQLSDPPFQDLEPCPDGLLGLGWHGLPQRFRDRGRIAHTPRYRK